jgi:hypothetical protein
MGPGCHIYWFVTVSYNNCKLFIVSYCTKEIKEQIATYLTKRSTDILTSLVFQQ